MTETNKNRQKGKKWGKGRKRRDELGEYILGHTCSWFPLVDQHSSACSTVTGNAC